MLRISQCNRDLGFWERLPSAFSLSLPYSLHICYLALHSVVGDRFEYLSPVRRAKASYSERRRASDSYRPQTVSINSAVG